MKILGENSLSSKVIIGLKALFTIIFIADFAVAIAILKSIRNIVQGINLTSTNNVYELITLLIIIITGIIALFIICQFIKIFKNLKENILFCKDNSKRLKIITNSCFVISIFYLISTILLFAMKSLDVFICYTSAFSLMLTVIFAVFAIGIMILNEIYKKAIKYKEENDFTI